MSQSPITSFFRRNEPVLIVVLAIAIAVFGWIDPRFLTAGNFVSITQQSAVIALAAFAMTAVIIARGIDISIGSALAFAGVAAGLVFSATGSATATLLAAIASGAAIGLLNGLLIGFGGISPFIATLATMAFARGLSLSLSHASSLEITDPIILYAGRATFGLIPVSVIIAAIVLCLWWFVLRRTVYGRWIYAIGGNAEAARVSMVPVNLVRISVYLISGATAGLGAILTVGRLGSAQPLAGTGLEFTAITAAIIGGTKLSGGQGSIWGTAVGALLLGVINTGLSFLQVPQIIIYYVTGALILVAVLSSQPEAIRGLVRSARRRTISVAPATSAVAADDAAHSISLVGIGKIFPGVKALDGVSFTVSSGEVVALAGENGAGKSTLVKCISGVYRPDEGQLVIDGMPVSFSSPNDAKGISVIHQHFSLSPDLTVAENMFVGREPRNAFGLLDRRRMRREAKAILEELSLDIDVDIELRALSVGRRQMVEIARAVLSDAWFMVMDEPTSALSNRERDQLYSLIARLRARGAGILYISHKMEEIFTQCDRVVVLRDGKFIGERKTVETTEVEIVSMMVGREVDDIFPHLAAEIGATAIEVKDVSNGRLLTSASLSVRCGEIVALAGLMGSGRSEVLRLIAGLETLHAGSIDVFGERQAGGSIKAANRAGIVYVPEDRHLEGFVGPMSIRDNLSLAWIRGNSRFGILPMRKIGALARELIASLGVRPAQPGKMTLELSGGNQQKVVIGKWLATRPRIILLDEPTRGVDVGAKSDLHHLIAGLKQKGAAILMVSSELPEVLGVADRIVVMREGRSVGELPRGATEEEVMALAFGEASRTASISPARTLSATAANVPLGANAR
ncbi:ATP-binding cassette domain-containing protein [Rhizobium sp. WW_1]|jgi:ribose transport system ATP-binding protein|uniref:ATP-binding cassette domain-containing protein n=1 Tax=Rhizobium sp. WW_1 TaxID=1907375 RepID=UPI0009DE3C64|nr:ATP-binding cassette domain-containing protein [Rhizobium sp. WW_1]RKD56124.1 monosaccharide ABC transporter ATP-binding protein (CUT2 family) [Rhizobium sp. WW_1]